MSKFVRPQSEQKVKEFKVERGHVFYSALDLATPRLYESIISNV